MQSRIQRRLHTSVTTTGSFATLARARMFKHFSVHLLELESLRQDGHP